MLLTTPYGVDVVRAHLGGTENFVFPRSPFLLLILPGCCNVTSGACILILT
jgi:hypothetical protein